MKKKICIVLSKLETILDKLFETKVGSFVYIIICALTSIIVFPSALIALCIKFLIKGDTDRCMWMLLGLPIIFTTGLYGAFAWIRDIKFDHNAFIKGYYAPMIM